MKGSAGLPGDALKASWQPDPNLRIVRCPGYPPRESAGHHPAAEGATGPRKRSGIKDRNG